MCRTNPDSLRSCLCFRIFRLNFVTAFFDLLLVRLHQAEIIIYNCREASYAKTQQRGLGGSWTINRAIMAVVKSTLRTIRPRCQLKTSQNTTKFDENLPKFFVQEGFDIFSLFTMPKRRTFGHFLASSENKLFFVKKEEISSKKGTYGKPSLGFLFFWDFHQPGKREIFKKFLGTTGKFPNPEDFENFPVVPRNFLKISRFLGWWKSQEKTIFSSLIILTFFWFSALQV